MTRPDRLVSAVGAAFRNEDVRRVEVAWGAAIASEWAHFVALGVFAYESGGTSAVGVAGLVRLLPAALVAPFAASLGDRFRRERFLVVIALVGSGALAGSAGAAFADERALVFALGAVVGLATTLLRPALQALLPSLVRTPGELISANGATSTIESLGTLAGPLAAGLLVSVADVGVVFVVASGAFLAAAALFARVRVEGRVELTGAPDDNRVRRMLAAGFRAMIDQPTVRLVIGLAVAQTLVRGCLNVLLVVAAFRVLGTGAGGVGYLTAAIGVGGLVGAVAAMTLAGRPLAVPFGLALVFWGLPIGLVAPLPYLATAVVLLAVVGAANSIEDVAAFTLLQRLVPDDILTSVLGVLWGLAMGAVAVGSIAAPALVAAIGPRAAFVVVGSFLPLLTLLTYRRLVRIDETVAAAPELALIDRVPMFAPLSVAAKEWVAAHLLPLSVAADEVVIRAGDPGDRFYIVGDGELEVVADDRRAAAVTGDYFGEIALLRDVARTATVRAAVDSRLYALERHDFLSAVTGHSGARSAGQAVVEARLAAHEAEGR